MTDQSQTTNGAAPGPAADDRAGLDETNPETLHNAAAAIGLSVGVAALIAPHRLVQAYGVDPDEMSGVGAFGWRLFAVRNVAIGLAALGGDNTARRLLPIVQPPDQLVFLHAARAGHIPWWTCGLAMVTSTAVMLLGIIAKANEID